MPILWRYLLGNFLKVLIFCLSVFVSALLMMRLEEIAHFASLGASLAHLFTFIFFQLPYILPIALPVACLISALLLMQRLSNSHELTAIRSCGQGLAKVLAPLCIVAMLLSTLNFYIVSELATEAHLTTALLKNELRSINPLLLLQNKHLMRLKGMHFETRGDSYVGEFVQDSLLAIPESSGDRITLLLAKELKTTENAFEGTNVTLLSTLPSSEQNAPDSLLVENDASFQVGLQHFSQLIQKQVWVVNNDHLRLSLLFLRLAEVTDKLKRLESIPKTITQTEELKTVKKSYTRCCTEILRRISLALGVFTLTFLGLSFGISIGRKKSLWPLFSVICLVAFYLTCTIIAKNIDHRMEAAALLYIAPHLILFSCCLWRLNRLNHGYV